MEKRRWKRTLSLILSAAMVWSMIGMPAFAEGPATPAPVPVVESEVPLVTDPQPETKTCTCTAPCAEGSVNTGCLVCTGDWSACALKPEEPQPEDKTCTCDPKVEGEGEHTNPKCPFYKEPQPEEKVCACDPKVEGEEGHTNPECPFYKKDEVPTENEETKALIEKLPSLEEYHQWQPTLELAPEDEGYQAAYDAAVAAHRKEVEEQVKAARAAYDLMNDEQKAAFDPALTAKLTTWETKLSQPVTEMEGRLSGLPSVDEFQNWKPTLTIPETDPGYQAAYDAAVAAHRKEVEDQVKAVRGAYDALSDAQRAVLDPALVAKLDALMALLTQAVPLTGLSEVYVSKDGNDESGKGSMEQPFASLAKAVNVAEDGAVIYIMTDLEVNKLARITDKHLTITSAEAGSPVTLTRGSVQGSDNNQSHYNSAMIEVTTNGDESSEDASSVTLTNIILTDNGGHDGTYFAQTNTKSISESNLDFVQDGMITAHGKSNRAVKITLDNGAVLRDYGGMSAVYGTMNAHITMNLGSSIIAPSVTDRVKSDAKPKDETGAAGAVWLQGAEFVMESGASISNMVGRAVYVDGGSATIGGTIDTITADGDMWQGMGGAAVHIRNKAEGTLTSTGTISNITGEHASYRGAIMNNSGTFTTEENSHISGVKNFPTLYSNYGTDHLNGIIEECSNDYILGGFANNTIIEEKGVIRSCTAKVGDARAVVYTSNASKVTLKGTVIDNTASYAFYIINQSGGGASLVMEPGALISGKKQGTGVYVNASSSSFTMNGGTIENFSTGVYCRGKTSPATFIMNDGQIINNSSYALNFSISGKSKVQLNDGTIQNNGTNYQIFAPGGSAQDEYENIYINEDVLVGNRTIYTSFGTITLDEGYSDIWLGKAFTEAKNKLVEKVQEENSNYNFAGSAALWFKPSQNSFHFTMPRPYSVKDGQSLYWGLIPLNPDGTPKADAEATVEKVKNAETLSIELKDLTPNQPYAVGLFTKNAVNIVPANMIIYMGGTDGADGTIDNDNGHIQGSKTLPEPGFRVTLPKELNGVAVTALKLQYKEDNGNILTWEFVKYGDGNHDVYRILPYGDTAKRAVRMKFTNKDGKIITEDKFDAGKNLNQTLDMEIYGEGIEAGKVSVVYDGKHYEIDTSLAEITVLGTTAKEQYGILGKNASAGKPGLTAPDGTTFTVNNSSVQVNDKTGIALLFDGIIEDTSSETNRTQLLQKRANEAIKKEVPAGLTRHYDLKYLDLVDRNNGNAWVTASNDVTVSWPYPAGTDKSTEFTLLHFEGLHRDMASNEVAGEIASCNVDDVPIVAKTDTHITFTIGSSGFSPFALVWDSAPPTPGPDEPGNGGSGRPGSSSGGSSTYDPQAKDPDRPKVSLEARKLLDGKTPGKQEFTFTLTDEKGKVVRTAENKGGKIVFDSLALLPGTYRYTMEEVNGSGGSAFGYDDTVYEAEVFVYTSGGKYTAMVSYYQDGKELDELPTFRNTTAPAAPGTDKENPITGGGPAFPAALTAAVSLGAIAFLWRKRS